MDSGLPVARTPRNRAQYAVFSAVDRPTTGVPDVFVDALTQGRLHGDQRVGPIHFSSGAPSSCRDAAGERDGDLVKEPAWYGEVRDGGQ